MAVRCVVWDWNGTLLDDVDLCVSVVNAMLQERGNPGFPSLQAYRETFCFPVKKYYEKAGFDFSKESFEKLAAVFIEAYHKNAPSCPLMPGAKEVLQQVSSLVPVQILASASEEKVLKKQVAQYGLTGCFQQILGIRDHYAAGKSQVAKTWLEKENIPFAETLFIGDSVHDWEVAHSLGAPCVLVQGGHQSVEKLRETGSVVLDHLAQFPAYLKKLQVDLSGDTEKKESFPLSQKMQERNP